ncbi:Protein CBP3, mitochondrial, partial [Grifola frondosa]
MVARSILARRLRQSPVPLRPHQIRSFSVSRSSLNQPSSSSPPAVDPKSTPSPEPTWLTRKLRENPAAKKAFVQLMSMLGYGTKKQVAGWRAFALYKNLCITMPDEDSTFWKDDCHLPPTFQSWFTVTNLHVWLLTVRLRALPSPHGMNHIQALVDHFFLDIEDRVRAVLQPASPNARPSSRNLGPYTPPTEFYTIANGGNKRPRGKAPERLVTKQMKIFKEQWAGMGMSFDLGLARSDAELAAAIWRNILGARGARGIVRSINLVGGEVEKVEKIEKVGLEVEEARDDGSGVHDYLPAEADKYVAYPELMTTLVEYIRRELRRLEAIPDDVIVGKGVLGTESEGLEGLKFGR